MTRLRCGPVLLRAEPSPAIGALERLANNCLCPAVVVTLRDADTLAGIVPADVRTVVLPPLGFREGFVVTTSVLVMAAALVRAFGGDDAPAGVLPKGPSSIRPTAAEQLLVLTTPGGGHD